MTEATRQLCLTLRHMNRRGIKLLVERAMALPATPSATLPSAATLTSSELYTQTLAAQKDVLRAAAAWPVLVNSLTELTNPPDRQQLAIVMGSSLTGTVFSQADIANQVFTHPGTTPGYTLLQELEEICHRDPVDLYQDPDDYHALVAGNERDELLSIVSTMRQTHLAQAIGAALSTTMSQHVSYAFSQAQLALDAHLDKIKVVTASIETELQAMQVAQAKLTLLLGVGPEKIGIDETRKRHIDRYSKDLKEYDAQLTLHLQALTTQQAAQVQLDTLFSLPPHTQAWDHAAQVLAATQRISNAKLNATRIDERLQALRRGKVKTTGGKASASDQITFSLSNLGKKIDESTADKLRKLFVSYFKDRDDLHMARMFVMRTIHDFDPCTGEYWRAPPSEIPAIFTQRDDSIPFYGGLQEANNTLYDDVFDNLTSTMQKKVSNNIVIGRKKAMVKIDKGDGIGLCYVLMHIHTLHSQARQNALLKELDDGEDALRTGNPGAKIRESLRPALETLNEMQIPILGVQTLEPMSRVLSQRDSKFMQILTRASSPYPDHYNSMACNDILMQYFAEAEAAALEIEGHAHCSPQELWKNNPFVEGKPQSANTAVAGKKKPRTEDADPVAGVAMSKNQRKKLNKKLAEQGIDIKAHNAAVQAAMAQVRAAATNTMPTGTKGKQVPSGKGKVKGATSRAGKGGKGTGKTVHPNNPSLAGQTDKPLCQAMGCTHPWNPSKVGDADRDICMRCRRTAILAGYTYTHKTLGALKLGSLHQVATATSQAVHANAAGVNPAMINPMLIQQRALYQQQLQQMHQAQAGTLTLSQQQQGQQQQGSGTQTLMPQHGQAAPLAMQGINPVLPQVNPFVQAQLAAQAYAANPLNLVQGQGVQPFPIIQGTTVRQCGSSTVTPRTAGVVSGVPVNPDTPSGVVPGVVTGTVAGVPASYGYGVTRPDPHGLGSNTLTQNAYTNPNPDTPDYRFTH